MSLWLETPSCMILHSPFLPLSQHSFCTMCHDLLQNIISLSPDIVGHSSQGRRAATHGIWHREPPEWVQLGSMIRVCHPAAVVGACIESRTAVHFYYSFPLPTPTESSFLLTIKGPADLIHAAWVTQHWSLSWHIFQTWTCVWGWGSGSTLGLPACIPAQLLIPSSGSW
jgi:hypothetical protein